MTTRFGPAHSTCPVTSRPTQLAGLSPLLAALPSRPALPGQPRPFDHSRQPKRLFPPILSSPIRQPLPCAIHPSRQPAPPLPSPARLSSPDLPTSQVVPRRPRSDVSLLSRSSLPDKPDQSHSVPFRLSRSIRPDFPSLFFPTPLRQPSHRYPTGQDTPIRIPTDRSSQSQPPLSDYPDHAHFSPTSRLTPRQFSSTIRALSAQIKYTTDFPALLCPLPVIPVPTCQSSSSHLDK